MARQILLVHDDPAFTGAASGALREAGYEVMVFPDPLVALNALERAEHLDLLITRVEFPAGRSNGASLALMARIKQPGAKVLFLCRPEHRHEVADLGEILPLYVFPSEIVAAAARAILTLPGLDDGMAARAAGCFILATMRSKATPFGRGCHCCIGPMSPRR